MSAVALRVVVVLLLVPPLVVAGAVAVVLAPPGDPLAPPVDAVVALAGEGERLNVASDLAEEMQGRLVVSWIPGSDSDRDERCTDDEDVRCFVPLPVSTAGEARSLSALAAEEGWERIVVVTSRYHVGRARVLLGQCADGARIQVVSATDGLPASNIAKESLGVLAGVTFQRAC